MNPRRQVLDPARGTTGPLRTAYVGLGSNLNEPQEQIHQAFRELAGLRDTYVVAQSSLYRSAPVGRLDQPEFVNAVVRLETRLAPAALLRELLRIEEGHGRQRSGRDAARTLDLDLLLYDEETISRPGLTVPHPRMHERAFVLRPLLEMSPEAMVPGRGRAADYLATVADQIATRIDG